MARRQEKPDYRYKYLKSFHKNYLFISWGTIVASLAFASYIDNIHARVWAVWGVSALVVSILIDLWMLVLLYIGAGAYWDSVNNGDQKHDEFARKLGKVYTWAMLVNLIILLPLGLISSLVFVFSNL